MIQFWPVLDSVLSIKHEMSCYTVQDYLDGLVQDDSIFSELAIVMLQISTNTSNCFVIPQKIVF